MAKSGLGNKLQFQSAIGMYWFMCITMMFPWQSMKEIWRENKRERWRKRERESFEKPSNDAFTLHFVHKRSKKKIGTIAAWVRRQSNKHLDSSLTISFYLLYFEISFCFLLFNCFSEINIEFLVFFGPRVSVYSLELHVLVVVVSYAQLYS